MATETIAPLTDHALPIDPKCLWKPSNPQDTQMEKFRELMQAKYQQVKLGSD